MSEININDYVYTENDMSEIQTIYLNKMVSGIERALNLGIGYTLNPDEMKYVLKYVNLKLESTIVAQKKVIEGLEANLTREISIVDYQRTQIQNLDTLLNEQATINPEPDVKENDDI